jgi:hypothetical protein
MPVSPYKKEDNCENDDSNGNNFNPVRILSNLFISFLITLIYETGGKRKNIRNRIDFAFLIKNISVSTGPC